ncbi:MAG: type IV pilus secretin PilQ [Candidatus Omnitrophica bacterium]|nr:type IV pilus secretin PilQ [Candidatus Omnitrophota bacterium]
MEIPNPNIKTKILLFVICNLLVISYFCFAEEQTAVVENLDKSQYVTLDFKEADIRNVLKIISYKSGVNIVFTPEVIGNVTIRLTDVPWERALDVVLKTYGYAYERQGNIITVAPFDKLTAQKKQEVELAQVQPTITEVFALKYIDAQDAKKALEPQLSPRGKITVLEMTGQAGWEFAGADIGKRKRVSEERLSRSKVLIVSDVAGALAKIKEVIAQIDVMPQQVMIETRIVEVNKDLLRDLGFDWGTGSEGAESSTITSVASAKTAGNATSTLGGHTLGSQVKPSGFGPLAGTTTTAVSSAEPFNVGLELLFRKLTGTQFETMLHMLEEDVNTNTLSAPRIMALNNQEATILVGTKYPILKTEVATDTSTTNVTLDYYQDIGIQLNVVPQVGANNYINMVIHPAVTSYTDTLGTNAYPIIQTREAETRVLMKDGETVVIGGLLKDAKTKSVMGVPFLSKIPLLGLLFKRETIDTTKTDLLIFISARIVKEGELTPEEIAKLEERLERRAAEKKVATKKNKKNQ